MARSRSLTRGTSATRRKTCSRKAKTRAPRSSSTSTGKAAAQPFEQWADEWLAKKKVEKVKRGRIVPVRDAKTIEVLELRVGYVKARFGKLCRQDIKRPDVLAFVEKVVRNPWTQ